MSIDAFSRFDLPAHFPLEGFRCCCSLIQLTHAESIQRSERGFPWIRCERRFPHSTRSTPKTLFLLPRAFRSDSTRQNHPREAKR